MKVRARQGTAVTTLGAMLISAIWCAISQAGSSVAPIRQCQTIALGERRRRTARAARLIGCPLTKWRKTRCSCAIQFES